MQFYFSVTTKQFSLHHFLALALPCRPRESSPRSCETVPLTLPASVPISGTTSTTECSRKPDRKMRSTVLAHAERLYDGVPVPNAGFFGRCKG